MVCSKKFVCHHSWFQKVPRDQNKKGISKNADCHSSICIKVKLDTPKIREVDDFLRAKTPTKNGFRQPNNKHKAKCHLCNKEFDIGRMGESAVKVHMKGLKHISLMEGKKTGSIVSFCKSTKPAKRSLSQSKILD
ncbi:hypothetical protein JTE90_014329 [Oedothorax gibbosus]|uniref:Uncharacterized protein n=1 Tax=Oedothorax gibbosus TaxID=931172 RepID=A0AAV6TTS7_9ARAC|nr:hypothetical protein JTE90_014329 [Oedothorax gibbosus]